MGGLVDLQGSGQCLKDEKQSFQSSALSIIAKSKTVKESINLLDQNVLPLINLNVLSKMIFPTYALEFNGAVQRLRLLKVQILMKRIQQF